MSLIKWTPRNTFLSPFVGESMLSDMDRFINSFFSGGLDMNTVSGADWLPAFDVIEKDKEYEVRVEAPGMKKGDFGVTVKDGVLTITGEKRAESSDDRKGYAYRESRQGKFSRSFRLPEEVNEKKIGASYTSGVLSVSIPRSKPIEVKEGEGQIK